MLISVVIPLYQKAAHISRALESVLAQSYTNFEVIVVDDGSTDGGAEIVRRFYDPRMRLISQVNCGPGAARNRGIREAASEFVAFLDADDEWLPFFLDTVMGLRERYPEAGLYATAYRCLKGNTSWRPDFMGCPESPEGGLLKDYFLAASRQQPVHTSAVMIPKHVLKEVGLFPESLTRGEDLQTWSRIALRYRAAWSPTICAVYHLSADNRACLRTPVNLDPLTASVVPIEEFLESGYKTISDRRNMEEYCCSIRLNLATECYLESKISWALYNIQKSRNTSKFRTKRLFLRVVIYFPIRIIKWGLAARERVRQIWTLLAMKCRNRSAN